MSGKCVTANQKIPENNLPITSLYIWFGKGQSGLKSLYRNVYCNQCYSYLEGIAAFFDKNNVAMKFLKSHGTVNVKYPEYVNDCTFKDQGLLRCTNTFLIPKTIRAPFLLIDISKEINEEEAGPSVRE